MQAPFESFDDYLTQSEVVFQKVETDINRLTDNDIAQNENVFESNTQEFINEDLNTKCLRFNDNDNPTLLGTVSMLKNLYMLYQNNNVPSADVIKAFVCALTANIKNRDFNLLRVPTTSTSVNDCFTILLNQAQDPLLAVESLKNDVFLSQTLFNNAKFKYLARGANGTVDKIEIENNGYKFNMIQKSSLVVQNELYNELIRELVVGLHLLFYVRDQIPNFTMTYGIYGCCDAVAFTQATENYQFDDFQYYQDLYENVSEIISQNYNIFNVIDNNNLQTKNIANLDLNNYNYYLLTDFSKGPDLGKFMKESGSNVNHVVDIMFQVVRALLYAYDKIGYVHNDFHMGNSIVTSLNEPTVLKDPLQELSGYSCHNTDILVKIIDYGYSSINGYPRFQSNILSDENTTVHNDILKFGLSIASTLLNYNHVNSLPHVIAFILAYYFKDLRKYSLDELISNVELCREIITRIENGLDNSPFADYVAFKYNPISKVCEYGFDICKNTPPNDIYKYMGVVYRDNESKFDELLTNDCNPVYYSESNNFINTMSTIFSQEDRVEIENKLSYLESYFVKTLEEINMDSTIVNDQQHIDLIIESTNSYIALIRLYTYLCIDNPEDMVYDFNNINEVVKSIYDNINMNFGLESVYVDKEETDPWLLRYKILQNLSFLV